MFIQPGKTMNYTNGTGSTISGRTPLVVGSFFGVAVADIADGDIGAVDVEGVHGLPKAAEAISQGDILYWDADGDPVEGEEGSGALTATSTDNSLAGLAFEAAGETDALVAIKINA